MEEFIDFNRVKKMVQLPVLHIHSQLKSKQFPLPVKDKNGFIVWVKSEILEFSKRNGHLRTFNVKTKRKMN